MKKELILEKLLFIKKVESKGLNSLWAKVIGRQKYFCEECEGDRVREIFKEFRGNAFNFKEHLSYYCPECDKEAGFFSKEEIYHKIGRLVVGV